MIKVHNNINKTGIVCNVLSVESGRSLTNISNYFDMKMKMFSKQSLIFSFNFHKDVKDAFKEFTKAHKFVDYPPRCF